MTHVLISLNEIESRISGLQLLLNRENTNLDVDYENINYIQGRKRELENLLNIGKHISLDEKDINKKALNTYPIKMEIAGLSGVKKDFNKSDRDIWIKGYKEVLKDLS